MSEEQPENRLLERYLRTCPMCAYPVSKYDALECRYVCALCGHAFWGAGPGETEPKRAPLLPSESTPL